MMSNMELIAWTTAIAGGVGSAITLLCTKGVDAVVRLRGQKQSEADYEDKRADKAHELVIVKLEARVTALESDLRTTREEHIACVEKYAMVQGQLNQCLSELEHLRTQVAKVT